MGVPEHFSSNVMSRCQYLIEALLPTISNGLPEDQRFGGPLRTTFLLAMATPMIVLPIERLVKPARGKVAADDTKLNEWLGSVINDTVSPTIMFGQTPFAKSLDWRYVSNYEPFNIAHEWPNDLIDELASKRSHDLAMKTDSSRILTDLRNALAHGGVAYLNKDGKNSYGDAAFLAFVGTKKRNSRIEGLNILRISENDFVSFLRNWAKWIESSSVSNALAHDSAFAA